MSNEQEHHGPKSSPGKTILFLVIGILAYVGIQWLMPKVGLNS